MPRLRTLALALCGLVLVGCAGVRNPFLKETGQITLTRQQFVQTYATVRVLYKRLRAEAERYCRERPPQPVLELDRINCAELTEIDRKARALAVQIDAKLEVPEAEVDWAVVKELLGALVSLVP